MVSEKRVREAAEDLVRVQFGGTSSVAAKSAGEDMRDWQISGNRVKRAAKKAADLTKKNSSVTKDTSDEGKKMSGHKFTFEYKDSRGQKKSGSFSDYQNNFEKAENKFLQQWGKVVIAGTVRHQELSQKDIDKIDADVDRF